MPLWNIHQVLAATPGTGVALELLRDGAPSAAEFELAEFDHEPPALTMSDGIAILRLPALDEASVTAVRDQLEELRSGGTEKLLLDLRNSVSAEPEAGYAMARLFADGSLGSLSQGESVIQSFESDSGPVWDGEVAVLVGRGSFGAAEVLASVLRESLGAQLVGQVSFGHAGRSNFVPLSNGAHLLLTDAYYSGPGGEPLSEGLEPDVVVGARQRRFAEKDLTLEDLTIRRGLELLSGSDEQLEEVA